MNHRAALTRTLALAAALGGAAAVQAESVFGVTQQSFLVRFDSATPGTIQSGVALQGLSSGESLVGIDFRPATGELFGLGSFSRLYRIDPATGMASAVSPGPFTPALSGASFGFDFNPTVDRIRMVSDADQNLRANPATGAIAATDPNLVYAAGDPNFGRNPNVSHAAYTNSFAGATSTTLYGLDAGTDALVRHTVAPGFAELVTVGPMGADVTDVGGFDISGATGVAYAAVREAALSRSSFWTIDLATGAGTRIGEVGGGHTLVALAVVPEPAGLALLALAGLGALRRR